MDFKAHLLSHRIMVIELLSSGHLTVTCSQDILCADFSAFTDRSVQSVIISYMDAGTGGLKVSGFFSSLFHSEDEFLIGETL